MSDTCPICGGLTVTGLDVIQGRGRYADTPGGRRDRHTRVVEAAERVIEETTA